MKLHLLILSKRDCYVNFRERYLQKVLQVVKYQREYKSTEYTMKRVITYFT